MPAPEFSNSIRDFITRHIRTVEQLEILILFAGEPTAIWTPARIYDVILSTPQSVEKWIIELERTGLLEKAENGFRFRNDDALIAQAAALAEIYRTAPVRVIETIYQRGSGAAESFAKAFKLKKSDPES